MEDASARGIQDPVKGEGEEEEGDEVEEFVIGLEGRVGGGGWFILVVSAWGVIVAGWEEADVGGQETEDGKCA